MRLVVSVAALLLAANASAAVYKCKNADGAIEFKDKPCAPGTGGEIAVKGVATSEQSTTAAGNGGGDASGGKSRGAGSSAALTGAWCEYAVSMNEDGEKDDSTPAQWTFSGDTVEYREKRGGVLKSKIVRNGASFAVENEMLGGLKRDWEIVSQKDGELVVHGPIGGYFHFRRGACR